MKVILLAAGRGKRLKPFTESTPKPLATVKGEPLIVRHVKALRQAGFREIMVNLAWLGEQIVETLGDGKEFGVRISYSDEGTALETGGGIRRLLSWFGNKPFLAVNGDIWTDFCFGDLPSKPSRLAHLVLVPKPPEKPQGDFALTEQTVINTPRDYTFSGIGVYCPTLFDGCGESVFSLAPLLREAADKHQVTGQLHQGVWHDVGTMDRLQALNR